MATASKIEPSPEISEICEVSTTDDDNKGAFNPWRAARCPPHHIC